MAERHRLPQPLVRKVEGSNLVFRAGEGPWIKLSPPLWADALEAEIAVTTAVHGRLPAPVPEVIEEGVLDGWRYLISRHVPGVQVQDVRAILTDADRERLAVDLGEFIRAFRAIEVPGFEREFGPWARYLAENLADVRRLHRARGAAAEWADRIAEFVDEHAGALRALGPPVLVHADLTAEHIMLSQSDGQWRLSGVLDLADAMVAPAAVDLINPCIEIFRGRRASQRTFMRSAGVGVDAPFAESMMALALQHRFMHFEHWFAPEIRGGLASVTDIARAVFPD